MDKVDKNIKKLNNKLDFDNVTPEFSYNSNIPIRKRPELAII